MALIDQQDKGKKENIKESFITQFIKQLFSCFFMSLLQRYISPTSVKYSNFIGKGHERLISISF